MSATLSRRLPGSFPRSPPKDCRSARQGSIRSRRSRHSAIVNIGTGRPVGLLDFVDVIERAVGKPAIRRLMPMQPGDVPRTFASADLLEALTGYRPATGIEAGVAAFVDWYRWWRSTGSKEPWTS